MRNKHKSIALGIVTVAVLSLGTASTPPARAAVFRLENVTLSDGGSASGSFDYTSVKGYSNVNITTTNGTGSSFPFSGSTYQDVNLSKLSSSTELVLVNNLTTAPNFPRVYTLDLVFLSSLDKAMVNSSISLVPGTGNGILNTSGSGSKETFLGEALFRQRDVSNGGFVNNTVVAVPEGSPVPAVLVALVGLGLMSSRRQKPIKRSYSSESRSQKLGVRIFHV